MEKLIFKTYEEAKDYFYETHDCISDDADSNTIANIRGWGRLQYLPKGEETQDEIGKFVADAINEKLLTK